MERTSAMDRLHPGVSLLFFVCAVGGTLLLDHPLFRLISLCGALCCHAVLCPGRALRFVLRGALPLCAFAALLNPLFNHRLRLDKLVDCFRKLPGNDLHEQIENYVLSCGFTRDDIEKFRRIMLEKR